MSTDSFHPTTGPDMALSNEERQEAEAIVEAIENIPTVTRDELHDRYLDSHPNKRMWADEFDGSTFLAPDHKLPALDLPGFGESYDDCGVEIPHFCSDCGHRVSVGRTCARSMCPRCGSSWVTKRAPRMVSRIVEAAKMKDGAQYKHHAAISPPHDLLVDADDPLEKLFEWGHRFMDIIGMDGVMFYHPWRGSDAEGDDAGEMHEDDRGEWKNRLFSNRNWEGDVREELEHSPHLHLVGSCSWFPGGDVTKTVYENTGWVIHRITERNGSAVSLGDMHSVARAVTYCLSHTGIDTDGDRNRAMYRKHGSAFHNADLRTLDNSKEAVHRVAPSTLGIPSAFVECRAEVPDDECEHDHLDDLDDDGGVDDADRTSTDNGMTTCRGDLTDIDDAPEYLESEEWVQRVPKNNVENLRETYEEWEEAGGWQGWTDQATLEGDSGDAPPPT